MQEDSRFREFPLKNPPIETDGNIPQRFWMLSYPLFCYLSSDVTLITEETTNKQNNEKHLKQGIENLHGIIGKLKPPSEESKKELIQVDAKPKKRNKRGSILIRNESIDKK